TRSGMGVTRSECDAQRAVCVAQGPRWDEAAGEAANPMPAQTKKSRIERSPSAADTPSASREPIEVATAKRRASARSSRQLTDLPSTGCPADAPTCSDGTIERGPKGRSVMRKVALDLGVRKTSYCEVADGHVILRRTVESVRLLDRELGPDAEPAVVAVEACREAWFVHDLLTSWGNEVLILDTTRTRQLGVGHHGRKTDRIDAEVIARALEANRVHPAHVLSPHRRVLRNEISIRRAMVETRAQHVTTVRGLMREKGIGLPRCGTERFASRVRDTA